MIAIAARRRTRSRSALALLGVATIAVAGGCAGNDRRAPDPAGTPVGRDAGARAPVQSCPAHVRLVAQERWHIGVGVGPLAVAGDTLWVARPQAGTIVRVDASPTPAGLSAGEHGDRGAMSRTVRTPVSVAVTKGRLWVAERDADRVSSYDSRTLRRRTATALVVPVAVAGGAGGVWALSLGAGALYQIDPANGIAAEPIDSPVSDPSEMVALGDDLWLLGARDHGLSPVDGRLRRIVRAGLSEPAQALGGLSAALETVWLGETAKRSLLRIEAAKVAVRELPSPDDVRPDVTAAADCGVWVAESTGELTLADARTAAPLGEPLRVGRSIAALAPAGTGVWVTDPIDGTLARIEALPAS